MTGRDKILQWQNQGIKNVEQEMSASQQEHFSNPNRKMRKSDLQGGGWERWPASEELLKIFSPSEKHKLMPLKITLHLLTQNKFKSWLL